MRSKLSFLDFLSDYYVLNAPWCQNFRATDRMRKRIVIIGARYKHVRIQNFVNETLYTREVKREVEPCNWTTEA
jgi:hypothetical protein